MAATRSPRAAPSVPASAGSDLSLRFLSSRCCRLSLCLAGAAVRAGGSSWPATQLFVRCRALFVVSEPRLVVGEEDLGNKITSGAHSGFGEDVPQMALYGVHGDHQMVSDVEGRVALQYEAGQLLLPFGQAVGRHQ